MPRKISLRPIEPFKYNHHLTRNQNAYHQRRWDAHNAKLAQHNDAKLHPRITTIKHQLGIIQNQYHTLPNVPQHLATILQSLTELEQIITAAHKI